MRINHNISSLNCLNKTKMFNSRLNNNIQKLSSGVKINKAADDAAGMSISEKMKSQIRGLKQSQRNTLDGMSFIMTADSAVGDIISNLQRMRELTVQALNGTLEEGDIDAIQKEIDANKGSIKDIVENTEFNASKVLRPPILENPLPKTANIVFALDVTGSMDTHINTLVNKLSDMVDEIKAKGVNNVRIGITLFESTGDQIDFNGNMWTNSSEDVRKALEGLTTYGGTENTGQVLIDIANKYDFDDNVVEGCNNHIILLTDEPSDDIPNENPKYKEVQKTLMNKNIQLHSVATYQNIADLSNSTGGLQLNLNSSNWNTELVDKLGTHIGESAGELEEMQDFILQIGANYENKFSVELMDLRMKHLNVNDLNLLDETERNSALEKIDEDIKTMLDYRAYLGAKQNTLEHVDFNNSNYEVNITNANSRILDTDMALEYSDMLKNDVLLKSTQSMLTHSNNSPSMILNLLK